MNGSCSLWIGFWRAAFWTVGETFKIVVERHWTAWSGEEDLLPILDQSGQTFTAGSASRTAAPGDGGIPEN